MRNKAPPDISLPRPPSAYDVKWADSFVKAVAAAFGARPPYTQAVQETLLLSPDGSVYAVRVSNTGELTTELRSRP